MKLRNLTFAGLFVLSLCAGLNGCQSNPLTSESTHILNDVFWDTRDGQPIYSQGGGIFRFTDPETGRARYYWYGVHYEGAELYRQDPSVTQEHARFESVTCYSSDDLVNWTFEADVLTKEEVNKNHRPTWVGRLGVAYIPEAGKYAMLVQHGGEVMVATADSPTGAFTQHQHINMKEMIGTTNTGDQTVFVDDDGKAYLIYSYGRGRNKIYVSEIGVKDGLIGLLDCTQVFRGESREGNCLFKYKGKYYMCASNIYGWDSSYAYYLVADDIRGPYLPTNDMQVMKGCEADYAHVTQTGFFYTLKGSKHETVIYCGDRWADFAGNGLGYNQWFPLSFEGETPVFNSLSSWHLDAETGEWSVGKDNNYVKNGSFEADRNRIPSARKPVQDHLLGWTTTVLEGNRVAVNDSLSPVLNHMNSREDRRQVIGEKSLNISDKIAFRRQVSQVITSTPYVPLEDGRYILSAKVRNGGTFDKLLMYATSGDRTVDVDITRAYPEWTAITLKNVTISGGKVEIGFRAEGQAEAFCLVDDVTLVKAE